MLRSLLARLRPGSDGTGAGDEATDDEPSAPDSEEGDTAEETNSVWDLIPGWQYDGRHVESGGVARGEQEKAIRDVQRQAAEIERAENDSEPQADR